MIASSTAAHVFNSEKEDPYEDVEGEEARQLLAGDAVWVSGEMSDGTVLIATLSDSGTHLLQATSPPPQLSMEGRTTFTP